MLYILSKVILSEVILSKVILSKGLGSGLRIRPKRYEVHGKGARVRVTE